MQRSRRSSAAPGSWRRGLPRPPPACRRCSAVPKRCPARWASELHARPGSSPSAAAAAPQPQRRRPSAPAPAPPPPPPRRLYSYNIFGPDDTGGDSEVLYGMDRCRAQLEALQRSNRGARAVVSMSFGALVTPEVQRGAFYRDMDRWLAGWYAKGEGRRHQRPGRVVSSRSRPCVWFAGRRARAAPGRQSRPSRRELAASSSLA
jgi:hypothetical protein